YLSVISPVFERMFAADFMEKNSEEISVADVIAEEFLEFIAVLYPTECPIQ
ncbi:BTB/POZ domain containing protein, partial [Aphelenchoides avenae]